MLRESAFPLLCVLLTILQLTRMTEAVEVEVICVNPWVKTGFLGIQYYSWRRLYGGNGKPITECGEWHKLNVCYDSYTWVLRTTRNSAEEADMQRRRNKMCIDAHGPDYRSAQPGNSGADVWALFQSSDGALFGEIASRSSGSMLDLFRVRHWNNEDGAIFSGAFKKHMETHRCKA